MNKKAVRVLIGIIGTGMLITVCFFLLTQFVSHPFLKENAFTAKKDGTGTDEEETEWEQKKERYEQLPISFIDQHVLPYEENTKEIGQSFSLQVGNEVETAEGNKLVDYFLQCTINSAAFAKENVDTDAVYYRPGRDRVHFDAKYNILNEYSYVVVNVTLENTNDHSVEFYANSFYYELINPETGDRFPHDERHGSGELQGYKTRQDTWAYDKSYARVELAPGESYTCNLVYIEPDGDIEKGISYLKCWTSVDEESRFVRLSR